MRDLHFGTSSFGGFRARTNRGHVTQLRAGPLWITLDDKRQITAWWGHSLCLFHGAVMVRRAL